ncbi:MAG: PD-(D/E)XK nuclease domain-containing protein [Eubacteriaceae bacterium]|nr:PD-(D/E)XK nuclease domain-containing protein [Eubacteriaceae bacterium]
MSCIADIFLFKEISFVYKKEILDHFNGMLTQASSVFIQEALFSDDAGKLKAQLAKLLAQSVSCFDTSEESFYHGLVLGLCALMDNRYHIRSNREAGNGRFDIALIPRSAGIPGIIMELKSAPKNTNTDLRALAETALDQINERNYDAEMTFLGITDTVKYGVAFSGKDVEVIVE